MNEFHRQKICDEHIPHESESWILSEPFEIGMAKNSEEKEGIDCDRF